MKFPQLIALSFVGLTGLGHAEHSDWEIMRIQAAEGHPGYQEVTVRNTSDEPIELVRHWPFGTMAAANVCLLPQPTPDTKRFVARPGHLMTLIAEPCHYPKGWEIYMRVDPGTLVKAILPMMHGLEGSSLGLTLKQRNGRVIIGALANTKTSGQQDGAD